MLSDQLIFSEKRKDRIRRHLLFWLIWGSYFMLLHIASPVLNPKVSPLNTIPLTATESFLFLLLQVPITYITLDLILPIYIRGKKWLFATSVFIVTWCVYYFFYQYVLANIIPVVINWLLPDEYLRHSQRPASVTRYMGLSAVFLGGFSSTAFISGVRYIKQWYLKEQKNIQLQKENTEAQLQLLKAQVHPHFLFNTLSTIYTQTQAESPKGSKMIRALSDLLQYILMEGNKTSVPLDRELNLLKDYVNLEKIRYGNKLDLHYLVTGKTNDIYIAPLLLLPFVENCFKHGASNILQNPWISLTIEVNDTTFIMKVMNGKNNSQNFKPQKLGIGIMNVRQRLELLYKSKYDLQIREDGDAFVVDLKIELEKIQDPVYSLDPVENEKLYA